MLKHVLLMDGVSSVSSQPVPEEVNRVSEIYLPWPRMHMLIMISVACILRHNMRVYIYIYI